MSDLLAILIRMDDRPEPLDPDSLDALMTFSEMIRSWREPAFDDPFGTAIRGSDYITAHARALALSLPAWEGRAAADHPEDLRIRIISDAYALGLTVMTFLDEREVLVASTLRALLVNEPFGSWVDSGALPTRIDGYGVPAVVDSLERKGVVVRDGSRIRFDTATAAERPAVI